MAARRDLSRAVSADLDAIFRPAAPPARGAGRVRSFRPLARTGRQGRERSAAQVGAMAAVALIGVALGAVVADMPKPWRPAAPPAPVPVAQAAARPIAVPPVEPGPPVVLAQAVAPVPEPLQKAVERRPAKAPPKAKAKVRKAKATQASGYRCGRLSGAAEARCAYPQVMAADRRLRAAYARATRAGVARSTLVSYRSRWASLRHRADDQPSRVIRGYGQMAQDLNRLARDART